MLSQTRDRVIDDPRWLPAKQVVFEDGDHLPLERSLVRDQHNQPPFSKQLMQEMESSRLDIRRVEIGGLQHGHQLATIRLNGQLPFNPVVKLFQPLRCHPPYRPGLLRIPIEPLTTQKDMPQLLEIGVFTAHIKYGDKMMRRVLLL